jgi:hypothetical protein
MEILQLLENSGWIHSYEIQDFRQWSDGFYYRLRIIFSDGSLLFAKEYIDPDERNYSFHWQKADNQMVMRWDNAPHHTNISTFPHHKHCGENILENTEISLKDVLNIIRMSLKQ